MKLRVTREVSIPDSVKLARYARAPELGPGALFFSGGSALRDLSRELVRYTYNSIHIITPFDSGGSSAVLREAFGMPAIGDVRNRLMALADQSITGNPEIFELFARRLGKDRGAEELREELETMALERHPLVAAVPDPMRKIVRNHLRNFIERMPGDFDLRGASIGNLVLAAGYLENRRHFDPVIYIFSKLVEVRGAVRPVINRNLHLRARLADGTTLNRQHRITGKETEPPISRIESIELVETDGGPPVRPLIREKIERLIKEAELIVYPMGSFYTSVLANLLPAGVGRAIAANPCPKVFVPNSAPDPELVGATLADQVRAIIAAALADCPEGTPSSDILGYVLLDAEEGRYPGGVDGKELASIGVEPVSLGLVTESSDPLIDPERLARALLSLT